MSATTPSAAELMALSDNATPSEWRISTESNDPTTEWTVADLGGGGEPVQVTIVADMIDYCRPAEDDAEFICGLVNWFRSNASTLTTPQPADGVTDEMVCRAIGTWFEDPEYSLDISEHVPEQVARMRKAMQAVMPTPTAPATDGDARRVFYVLESFTDGVGGQYWAGNTWFNFTDNVGKAIQYCRRRDAEQVMFETWRLGKDIRVTEHMMIATPAATDAVRDGYVLVPREIVSNYAISTEIPRHRRICEEALAKFPPETKGGL